MASYCSASSSPPSSILTIRFCSSSHHHHRKPSPSKPNKPRSLSSGTLRAAGIALVTSALIAPGAALAVLEEPANALSLPTWAIHVSSVVEWVTAMGLAWEYGDHSGFEAWKGLCWGMVLPLGGALCACTWHFFYDSNSLEVLVAMQAALTFIGNMTMCFAAFRIFRESQGCSENS